MDRRNHRLKVLELHSSDLTGGCLRAVKHRHLGEFIPLATTALFRGSAAGKALEMVINGGIWSEEEIPASLPNDAIELTIQTLKDEHWEPSEAVLKNIDEIRDAISACAKLFVGRFGERLSRVKVIGCEVPIRAQWDPPFASHLDFLFRDTGGAFGSINDLHIWDFKYRVDAPTVAYMARNLQMASYFTATLEGSLMIEGEWVAFAEAPIVSLVHLPGLLPYTKALGDFKKGDLRPENVILYHCRFNADITPVAFHDEYAERASMVKAGHWPTNPSATGCLICSSEAWCRRNDLVSTADANAAPEPALQGATK